ncbi:MAG: BPSS1187 family protein [Erythrobacter sp.]
MSRSAAVRCLTLACCLALAACGGGDGAPPPTSFPPPSPTPTPTPTPTPRPASVERNILPADTSSAITTNLAAHFVINPDPQVAPKGRLFVMLPGTGATPAVYRDIVRTGAGRGYHALGLTYPNDEAVERLCGQSTDPDCAGRVRREIITGEDTGPLAAVNAANSIITRLTVLIQFLDRNFPAEGWGQFLTGGQPDWSRITVAGHSQGGGHAAFFAKLLTLDRTVMFAAPGDSGVAPGTAAPWLSLPNVTPPARQYGFIHVDDPLVRIATAARGWEVIGLGAFGPLTSVDGASPPFGNARQLTTALQPNPNPIGPSASPPHGAPVVDAVTPRDAQGRPVYAPVWIYLAFP